MFILAKVHYEFFCLISFTTLKRGRSNTDYYKEQLMHIGQYFMSHRKVNYGIPAANLYA